MTEAEVAEMIERYIDFVDEKGDQSTCHRNSCGIT
jgi:hypothetical protein